jgi:hypothetical protein
MALDTVSTERRKTLRKRPPRLIYVDLSAANGGMVRDISEEGFAVRAMMPLTPGEGTPFSFLLGESTRVEGEGQVVWVEDKGKVAGIRFTQMSAKARKDIQNWLNDVTDVPETKEEQTANAQNFDQLREELRNAPPRDSAAKPSKSRWPIQSPEGEPEGGFQEPAEEPPVEVREEREWRAASHPIPFPGAANSPAAHDNTERNATAHPPARDAFENKVRPEPVPRRAPSPNPPGHLPPLPDISKILMQPPKKASSYGHQAPVLEPLDSSHMYESRRGGGFTASRAIMIMIVLAAGLAIYAYRQTVGETLIWLGQQVSGPSTTQTSTPPEQSGTNQVVNPAATNPPATNPSSTPAPENSAAQPEVKQENNGDGSTEDANPVASKPSRPTTPLQAPSPVSSAVTSEAGSTEYSQAQQMLHAGDTSEAVRFLWIAVEKGNASAELTLAELYWHGRGVARNCDQTRILLSEAARKGNSDADKLLRLFQREGCE